MIAMVKLYGVADMEELEDIKVTGSVGSCTSIIAISSMTCIVTYAVCPYYNSLADHF